MTCREKYEKEHPELSKSQVDQIVKVYCPHEMGIGYPPESICTQSSCSKCWETDIPEDKPGESTEVRQEEKKESKKTMAVTVKKTMAVTVKKTKAQLIEELDQLKEHTAAVEKQLKNMEQYKQYEEAADEIKAMHTAFINAGFTDEQAFDMIKTMVMSSISSGMVKAVTRR